jgi:multidrug resistance protein MdtO
MGSVPQALPVLGAHSTWIRDWLIEELRPYPGRALLVARMVTAVVFITLICETFHIPYAWQAAINALFVSRENARATVQSAMVLTLATLIATAYILISMCVVISLPVLHFLWVVASLFTAFYAITALTNYFAAVAFVNMIAAGTPLWDTHMSAEAKLESTLWLCFAVLIAASVTLSIELVFTRWHPKDEIVASLDERLCAVENLLTWQAKGCAVDPAITEQVVRFQMLGTSLLRQALNRSNHLTQNRVVGAAIIGLVGRIVDLAGTLTQLRVEGPIDHTRFRDLASILGTIRGDLINNRVPERVDFESQRELAGSFPLLAEMEQTVALIPQVFESPELSSNYLTSANDPQRSSIFVADAFVNTAHVRFALKGCLAATAAYVIYNWLDWPEISTAVTTCLLTALSTLGASHQKQFLRIAGAIVGGFILGIGSQIFILPYLDSAFGFIILFIAVTAFASWFLTSSPRLSYFGVQVALAFYLINLQEFKIQTSLTIGRDRVVGVLLGLFIMWIVFDQLWGAPTAVEMKRIFITVLRLMGQFARGPDSKDMRQALARSAALREAINSDMNQVLDLTDGVLFEFGPSRQTHLELRDQVRRLIPQVRTLFLMRITSLKYRLQLPGFDLPEPVRILQRQYDEASADKLEQMADQIEYGDSRVDSVAGSSQESLTRKLELLEAEASRQLPAVRAHSLVGLIQRMDTLTNSLAADISTLVERR